MELDGDSLLDLSFLSEEEQNTIAEVLRRDSELRMLEEGRISKLRESVSDPSWLKVLSGDWFGDARAKRHRCNPLGADIVRASIRRKKARGEWEPKQRASLGELEAIYEPPAEEEEKEGSLDVPDGAVGQHSEAASQLPWPKGTPVPALIPQRAALSPEQGVDDNPESSSLNAEKSSSSFSSLSSLEEEAQPNETAPAIVVTVQSNGSLKDGQDGASGAPPLKNNVRSPPNKLLNTSSSFSSLSSSTMSGSLMSIFSDGEIGCVDVRGCIQFSLQYEPKKRELHIQVIQCRDLAEAKKQRSDPYVKAYLLPDKSNQSKRKTTVKKRSLDPIFNETLKYKIEKADLPGRILNLSVWHHDSLSRNLFMGEVEVALESWDWNNTGPLWFNLQPRPLVLPDALSSRGTLSLALKFIPAGSEGEGLPPTGELHIWVKTARNLISLRGSSVDSFVQCYILPDDSKASRQKTRLVKKSFSPTFNHTMVYDGFQAKDLVEACAEFIVWERDTFSKHQLGGIRLSLGTGNSYGLPVLWMDSTEEERYVWEMVFKQPGQWVDAQLPLRTNLTPRPPRSPMP